MRRARSALSRIVRSVGVYAFFGVVAACSRADPPLRPAPEPTSPIVAAAVEDDDPFAPSIARERLESFERDGWRIDGRFDVNGDGIDDAFFHNPGWCGSGGCTTPLVVSHDGLFSPAFAAFAVQCWPADDAVADHRSIDCIYKLYTCGPYLFLTRARWSPAAQRWIASDLESEERALPTCRDAVLTTDASPRLWPMGDVELAVVRDDDESHFEDDAISLTGVRHGPFRPMLLEGRDGVTPHVERAAAREVIACLVGDELAAGTALVLDARAVDAFGEAWVRRTAGGWLRESDVRCVTP